MTDESLLPNLSGLRALLSEYLGKRAYIVEMTDRSGLPIGNNGDHLMLTVFERILENFALTRVADRTRAEVVLVPPNGAILEAYNFPDILAERLIGLEHVPLVIFPSSAYFPNRNPSFIFRNRQAETVWILREKRSFDHLKENWLEPLKLCGVRLALDHDVVASGHAFVPTIIGAPLTRGHTLIAARVDREATSLIRSAPGASKAHSKLAGLGKRLVESIPHPRLRTGLARVLRLRKLRESGARLLANASPAGVSLDRTLPVRFVDSSATQFATFDEYREALRNADLIITDRLHVGLPGAILGKRVVLVEAGYHKLGGVFKQSLSRCPNVVFVNK